MSKGRKFAALVFWWDGRGRRGEHPRDPIHIHGAAGVLGQDQGTHRQVPGMLGRVFLSAAVQQRGLPHDGLEPVDFS